MINKVKISQQSVVHTHVRNQTTDVMLKEHCYLPIVLDLVGVDSGRFRRSEHASVGNTFIFADLNMHR